ncbi:MAG: hypothetical protein AUG44_08790 [Actinobacteria bacterium 13_1_20CM_3_71_11]|nr:MAG: hypothetical protein AUG44_08790 [Actinobacteria bacterium 13_1_20CM_3_71_11]
MAIDLGDVYRCSFTLTSPAGGLVNGGTVTITIVLPDGTSTIPVTVSPTSTGVYTYDYQTTQAGRHVAQWVSTGANPGAYVDAFDVLPANAPYLISLADAKAQLNITSTTQDEEIRDYLGGITTVIEEHLGQAVVRKSYTEQQDACGGAFVLNWSPVVSLTSVALLDGTYTFDVSTLAVSAAGVVTSPNGIAPYGRVTVTYTAGRSIIPGNYLLAARIILQHLWETQRGTKGAGRFGGLEDSMQLGTGHMGYAIPNRAVELLGGGIPGIA